MSLGSVLFHAGKEKGEKETCHFTRLSNYTQRPAKINLAKLILCKSSNVFFPSVHSSRARICYCIAVWNLTEVILVLVSPEEAGMRLGVPFCEPWTANGQKRNIFRVV